jgi:hypothetical protein
MVNPPLYTDSLLRRAHKIHATQTSLFWTENVDTKIRIHITTRTGNKDMSLNFNQEPFDSHHTTVLKCYLLLYKIIYI